MQQDDIRRTLPLVEIRRGNNIRDDEGIRLKCGHGPSGVKPGLCCEAPSFTTSPKKSKAYEAHALNAAMFVRKKICIHVNGNGPDGLPPSGPSCRSWMSTIDAISVVSATCRRAAGG